jgi:hypothetical protein
MDIDILRWIQQRRNPIYLHGGCPFQYCELYCDPKLSPAEMRDHVIGHMFQFESARYISDVIPYTDIQHSPPNIIASITKCPFPTCLWNQGPVLCIPVERVRPETWAEYMMYFHPEVRASQALKDYPEI